MRGGNAENCGVRKMTDCPLGGKLSLAVTLFLPLPIPLVIFKRAQYIFLGLLGSDVGRDELPQAFRLKADLFLRVLTNI